LGLQNGSVWTQRLVDNMTDEELQVRNKAEHSNAHVVAKGTDEHPTVLIVCVCCQDLGIDIHGGTFSQIVRLIGLLLVLAS